MSAAGDEAPGPTAEELRQCVTEAERAVEARPQDAAARRGLAEAYEAVAGQQRKAAAEASASGGSIHLLVQVIGLRRKAADSWTEAARLAPEDAASHSGRARALGRLAASLTTTGGDSGEVVSLMEAAVTSYARAFEIAPGDAEAHTRRGALLSSIGMSHQRKGEKAAALNRYREALVDLKAAQRLAPQSAAAVSEAGWVLVRMGGIDADMGRPDEAVGSLESAIAVFAEMRRLVPGNSFGPLSQGQAYTALGDVQARLMPRPGPPVPGRPAPIDRGISAYQQAISCFDAALTLEPGSLVPAWVKAETLQGLGELQVQAGRADEALAAFRDALTLYDGALARNTQSFQHQLGRGRSLLRAAELSADVGDHEAFRSLLEEARIELSRDVAVDAMSGAARAQLLERIDQHRSGRPGDEPGPRPN